jgi:hypothetical protein
MKRITLNKLLLIVVLLIFISSCAPSGYSEDDYGFFSGIWHGICIPFTIIGKIFGMDIGLYAENNSGTFYWIGMLIGIGSLGGGGASIGR